MNFEDMNQAQKDEIKKDIGNFIEDKELLDFLSSIFKVLADPTRLKIIYALSKTPLCVNDISNILGMSQSSISHQLALLRKQELIKVDRIGRKAIYSLDDDHVMRLFKEGFDHAYHKKKILMIN